MDNQRLQSAFEQITALSQSSAQIAALLLEPVRGLAQVLACPAYEAPGAGVDSARNQNDIERRKVDARLSGFSGSESLGWKVICEFYGPNLNQPELLSLAEVLADQLHLKVDRLAKRRKEVLIKWFDENIALIQPYLPFVKLEDDEGRPVTGKFGEQRANT